MYSFICLFVRVCYSFVILFVSAFIWISIDCFDKFLTDTRELFSFAQEYKLDSRQRNNNHVFANFDSTFTHNSGLSYTSKFKVKQKKKFKEFQLPVQLSKLLQM